MNFSAVHYRKAAPGDAPAMVGIHYEAVRCISSSHYAEEVLAAWSPTPDQERYDWLAALVGSASTVSFLAESAERGIVGFCIAVPESSQMKALYVLPSCSGMGIGRELLNRVEAHCQGLGLAELELKASFNAESFYRAAGYVSQGDTTQALAEGVEMGAVRMSKCLGVAKDVH
jgi:GNAT superfamily N-acetyltransferase